MNFTGQPGIFLLRGEVISSLSLIPRKIALVSTVKADPWSVRLFSRLAAFLPLTLSHEAAARDVVADAVVDLFDIGSTNSEGRIRLYTAGGIDLLATIPMANPAFNAAASGVATGAGLPWSDIAASGDGDAAEFDVIDRDEAVILRGAVAISGEEISFPDLEIAKLDIVKINSASYTASP